MSLLQQPPVIAYFSMEIGLEPGMHTYAGGLGVLAGDTLRAAADLGVPMIGVTLLHRLGYVRQVLDSDGGQREFPSKWPVEQQLRELPQRAMVTIEGRPVLIRGWSHRVTGAAAGAGSDGGAVAVLFLDTDLPDNDQRDRVLTDHLYGGDQRYRLAQEIVLGIGGVRMLHALGYTAVARYHMNEGHAALLGLELLEAELARAGRPFVRHDDIEAVRNKCVFTTHTPVPAGHDQFAMDLVERVLGHHDVLENREIFCCEGRVNLTFLALNLSGYVNGVAKRHAEISRMMFARYEIDAITNGVHAATWVSPPFAELFDRHVPDWRRDNFSLRYALRIPGDELWQAHERAKRDLIRYTNGQGDDRLDPSVLTIGFARRATAYKRADLLLQNLDRLNQIAKNVGAFQVIYAGKAHPDDTEGKELIRRIFRAKNLLRDRVRIVYLADYDMALCKLMTAGADLWLNTPQPPLEASGTSGMKAALNGVPSLGVLDGWWIEGCIEGVTGWAIGDVPQFTAVTPATAKVVIAGDAELLYDKLEGTIIPMFYRERQRYLDLMLHCIGLNGSFFNTHRMLQQYVMKAYYV